MTARTKALITYEHTSVLYDYHSYGTYYNSTIAFQRNKHSPLNSSCPLIVATQNQAAKEVVAATSDQRNMVCKATKL